MKTEKAYAVVIDEALCKGCGLCEWACPKGAIVMSARVTASGANPAELAHPDRCTGCRMCEIFCPDMAIEVFKK